MGEQRAKKVSEEEALKEAEETLKKVSDAKSDAIGKKVEKETKKSAP